MPSSYTLMEGPTAAEVLATPMPHAVSPPMTPNSREFGRATRGRPPPNWKRMAMYGMNFSPPFDDDFTSPSRNTTPERLAVPRSLSRPSTSSGLDASPSGNRSTPEIESLSETSERHLSRTRQQREGSDLVVEQLPDDDPYYMNHSGILHPDGFEDADSEGTASTNNDETEVVKQLRDLHCNDEGLKMKGHRRWQDRKKRWSQKSVGSKRTLSESYGSDVDDEDTKSLDFNEVGSSARRVKRRISGTHDRTSLIFDDPPTGHITEVDEPDEDVVYVDPPPPYSPVDWNTLRVLPFYTVPDPMRLDTDSDTKSNTASDSSE